MNNSIYIKFFCCLFAVSLLITSCTKEDIDMVEEEVTEKIAPHFNVTINGTLYEHEGYASYCKNGDKEFLQITNRPEFLVDSLHWPNLNPNMDAQYELGDFAIIYTSHYEDSYHSGPLTFAGTVYENEEYGLVNVWAEVDGTENTFTYNLMEGGEALAGSLNYSVELPTPLPNDVNNTTLYEFSVEFLTKIVNNSSFCE